MFQLLLPPPLQKNTHSSNLLTTFLSSTSTTIKTTFTKNYSLDNTIQMQPINKKEFLNKNTAATNENIISKLIMQNVDKLCTNIGNINYSTGKDYLEKHVPITEAFCDNIVVFKIISTDKCEVNKKDAKQTKVKQDFTGLYNKTIRTHLKDIIDKDSPFKVTCKIPLRLDSDTQTANGYREVLSKNNKQYELDKHVAQAFKIELSNFPLKNLLQNLETFLKEIEKEDFFLADLDITQDYTGIFNKIECIKYLQLQHGFNLQGLEKIKDNKPIILNNSESVGLDCLTFLKQNTRQKIYNKFVCQITSPGVTKKIGNHITDLFSTDEKVRLNNTFKNKLALDNGITRYETTIYNYSIGKNTTKYDPVKDCLNILDQTQNYFKEYKFYKCPLQDMWTTLIRSVKSSLTLRYNDNLVHVFYVNKLTCKATGSYYDLKKYSEEEKDKITKYILSASSFNLLPANYIRIKDAENESFTIEQKCYLKEGTTLITKQDKIFAPINFTQTLEEVGLTNTNTCELVYNDKKLKIGSKLYPFELTEIDFIKANVKSKKQLEEEDEEIERDNYLKNIVQEIKTTKELENKFTAFKEEILHYFRNKDTLEDEEIFQENDACQILAINIQTKKFTTVLALVLNKRTNQKHCVTIKGISKEYINKTFFTLIKDLETTFIQIPYNDSIIYLKMDLSSLGYFYISNMGNYNGNTYRQLRATTLTIDASSFTKRDRDAAVLNKVLENKIEFLPAPRLYKSLKKINELIAGNYLITHIGTFTYRNIERYIFRIKDDYNDYIANYWFAQEYTMLKNKQDHFNLCVTDKTKTTPTKTKETLVYLKSTVIDNDNKDNENKDNDNKDNDDKDNDNNNYTGKVLLINTLNIDSYTISKIKQVTYHGRERIIFYINGVCYIDNYFFIKELSQEKWDSNSIFNMNVLVEKTTPSKSKHKQVKLTLVK